MCMHVYNLLTCHVSREPNLKIDNCMQSFTSPDVVDNAVQENLMGENIRLQQSASSHGPSPASTHVDAGNTLICHLDNVHSECPCRFLTSYEQLTGKNQLENNCRTGSELKWHQNYK